MSTGQSAVTQCGSRVNADGSFHLWINVWVAGVIGPLSVCLSVLSVRNFGALWPNGCMDQDETWHVGRHRPLTHCVRWEPSSPPQRGTTPIFGPYLLWPNGCVDQHATWYGGTHRLRPLCQMGTPLPSQKGAEHFPNFRPMSIVTKRLDASRCHLVWI